jgi:hypothetical protein
LPFSYPGAEVYSLYFQVDPEDRCQEASEADNTYGTAVDTPVEAAFYAVTTDDGHVVLRWSFSSMPAVEAFNVCRGLSQNGPFDQVNCTPIPLMSPSEFEDTGVWPQTEFWYTLEGMSADGAGMLLAGPVSVRTEGTLGFRLALATPNPASRVTWLALDLPSDYPDAELQVYDVSGRLVRVVTDGPAERGRHSFCWDLTDASDLPVAAGVYFARASAGEWAATRKVVVVR